MSCSRNRMLVSSVVVHILLVSRFVAAQTGTDLGQSAQAVAGVNEMVAPSSHALVTSSLSTSKSGSKVSASFTPGELKDWRFRQFLSTLQIAVTTAVDSNVVDTETRLAVSTSYDPFHLRGSRAATLLQQCLEDTPGLGVPQLVEEATGVLKKAKEKKEVFDRIAAEAATVEGGVSVLLARNVPSGPLHSDLLQLLVRLKGLTGGDQSDERLRQQYEMACAETANNAAKRRDLAAKELSDTVSTLKKKVRGILALAVDYDLKRWECHIDNGNPPHEGPCNPRPTGDVTKQLRALDASLGGLANLPSDQHLSDLQTGCQWSGLRSTLVPSVTITPFVDVHPLAEVADADDLTATNETEPFGGVGFQVRFGFRFYEWVELQLWGSYEHARPNGTPRSVLVDRLGAGADVNWLFWSFLERCSVEVVQQECLERYEAYRTSGFAPGLLAGVSGQMKDCRDGRDCTLDPSKPFIASERSLTPYVEVRVTPLLQLRLSVPVTNSSRTFGETEVTPLLSASAQFSAG